MYKSKDGLLRVDQAVSLSSVVFPPASWSIINLPVDAAEAQQLFRNLYNSPTSRHVSLVLSRHRRKDRLAATANIGQAKTWSYLDTVSIWYEKPSTCSNNGLLPIAEPGFLLYKGDAPDAKRTEWFSKDMANATNLWNLATQEGEGDVSYYQKFSWEMNMLLMSLAQPLEHGRFIYGMPISESEQAPLFDFCKHFGIGVQLYAKTLIEAETLVKDYEKHTDRRGKK